jgi:hypothetical protein
VDGLAIYAALVATGNLAWAVWHATRSERFDVRVAVGPEPVVVGAQKFELTVTARNLGKTDEAVERMGVRFYDPTATEMAEGSVSQLVSEELPPNRRVRFTVDLAKQRYRLGRQYQGYVALASGRNLESDWQELEGYLLDLAGVREIIVDARDGPNLPPPSGPRQRVWQ